MQKHHFFGKAEIDQVKPIEQQIGARLVYEHSTNTNQKKPSHNIMLAGKKQR